MGMRQVSALSCSERNERRGKGEVKEYAPSFGTGMGVEVVVVVISIIITVLSAHSSHACHFSGFPPDHASPSRRQRRGTSQGPLPTPGLATAYTTRPLRARSHPRPAAWTRPPRVPRRPPARARAPPSAPQRRPTEPRLSSLAPHSRPPFPLFPLGLYLTLGLLASPRVLASPALPVLRLRRPRSLPRPLRLPAGAGSPLPPPLQALAGSLAPEPGGCTPGRLSGRSFG